VAARIFGGEVGYRGRDDSEVELLKVKAHPVKPLSLSVVLRLAISCAFSVPLCLLLALVLLSRSLLTVPSLCRVNQFAVRPLSYCLER
jgi:hypothetical protein